MFYHIKRLNRTIELDDNLVKEYTKYDELRDQPFSIAARSKFGHAPSIEEISDKELSILCNEVLLSELKALALLPQAISVIEQNMAEYKNSSNKGTLIEYELR